MAPLVPGLTVGLLLAISPTHAQSAADWYHTGNSLLGLSLAGLATGPVERVWYSPDGSTLSIATASGKIFEVCHGEIDHMHAGKTVL